MANRVLLGKRGTSDFGLFVSRSGDNVLTTTNPLSFDSRAPTSLTVNSFGQGILVPSGLTNSGGTALSYTFEGTSYTSSSTSGQASITHNLGYVPAFAIRWNTGAEMGFRVPSALIPSSDNDEASAAIEATGPTVKSGDDVYVEFGVLFDSGRTLKNTGHPGGSSYFATNPNYWVGALRSTSSSSNVTISGSFDDHLISGTDTGVLKFTPTLTSGTTGTYAILIVIEDNVGQDHWIKVEGTVTSATQTGRASLKVWTPGYAVRQDYVVEGEEDEQEEYEWSHTAGLDIVSTTTNAINIEYLYERTVDNDPETGNSIGDSTVCFYSYVIFTAPNFLNNRSF